MNYRTLFEHLCQIICTAFKLMCYNENYSAEILNRSSNSYFLWDFASLLKAVSFRPFLHGVDVLFPENNQKPERKS